MTHCRKHPDRKTDSLCKLCLEPYCTSCVSRPLFICEGCLYKILIVLLILMIVASFVVWAGLLG